MTAPARFRQSDLERCHKAAEKAGVREYRIKIDTTGGLEIIVGRAAKIDDEPEVLE